jgi:hypothetical protein
MTVTLMLICLAVQIVFGIGVAINCVSIIRDCAKIKRHFT